MGETPQQIVSILAVEDDPGDFGLIRAYARLAKLGITGNRECVTRAKTLSEGIAAARNNKPAVVLLDLSLPDSEGLATVQAMRAALPGVPIVVLTGRDDNALAVAALQAGAQDYLVKGQFDHDALGRTVRYALVRHHMELQRKESEKMLLDSRDHLKEQVGKMTYQLKELKGGVNTAKGLSGPNAPPVTDKEGSGQDSKRDSTMNINMRNQPELSQRQHQILKLLQAGKVNKEVAQELGIGLGTVKQHLVAIFKKLNVSNRAMAASHGMEIFHEQENRGTALPMADLLECRPCVVLSIALPQDASHAAAKLMYGSLAALASAHDAVFLARNGNAGDIIFGIQRVTEYDLAIALQTARAVYDDLLAMEAQMAKTGEAETGIAEELRGCMTAGVAFASMKRFGGWTGEAIASAAIASARELLNGVPPGQFVFDQTALDLIELFGIGGTQGVSPTMFFQELQKLHWTGSRRAYHLVGRVAELAQLYAALTEAAKGGGKLIFVEGEMGMGKSRLCDAIAKLCLKHDGRVAFCRSLPPVLGKCLYDTVSGTECSAEQVAASLRVKPACFPELIVVDDFHLLAKEQQILLSAAGADATRNGKLVIFSGRRGMRENAGHPTEANKIETISLRRLSAQAIQVLVRDALGKGAIKGRASKVQRITSAASGVPLFAVELARHHEAEQLALPLRVAINARLDSLHLDHNLLREVAKNAVGANLEEVAAALGENIEVLRQQMERAIAAGVLSCNEDGWLSFTHPLLRRAIDNVVVE
ncbi:MAG: response regulator [Nitrosomonadales bacterium]|nr:response regulator [Nitrosomonadales bacterium]